MGPPPRSFAADAHDCIMVRSPLDQPNTRVWRDDPRPLASSPLIVEARLSPSNLCSRLRTAFGVSRQQGWLVGATKPTGRPCRQRTVRCSQGWTLKRVRPGPKRWPWSGRKRSRPGQSQMSSSSAGSFSPGSIASVSEAETCSGQTGREKRILLSSPYAIALMITRLRLDARLFEPPPPRRRGTMGRPCIIGERLPTLLERLANPTTAWQRFHVSGWYGGGERLVEIISGTAIWHHPGKHVPIRYVLVRDVAGAFKPQAFLCTDLQADPLDILRWFVRRWATEVTFAEVRRHLGVETQRQWSDKAIARTTPALLGLFSLVTLWTSDPGVRRLAQPRGAAWYQKRDLTFSDALAAVRRSLWAAALSNTSRQTADITKVETAVLDRLIATLCYSA